MAREAWALPPSLVSQAGRLYVSGMTNGLVATTPLPVSAIRVAGAEPSGDNPIYFSTFDPDRDLCDPPGEQGIYLARAGQAARRVLAWPRPVLIAVDEDHLYFRDGSVRRVRLGGGDVCRVFLGGFDAVVERKHLFGVGYTYLARVSRRPSFDSDLDGEDSDMTHYKVSDPRRVAVDARYVYATVGHPPHTQGSREAVVRIPKQGGVAEEIAQLREQASEMSVAGTALVVLLHDGPIVTMSTDGGAVHEIQGTEGVERFQVASDMIYWVAPFEPHARLVRRRVSGGPIETVADLGRCAQPRFWVSGDDVVWASPTSGGYRADGRAREHQILTAKLRSG